MPGADDLEDAWLRARLGEDGYLAGKDAETAACDAQSSQPVQREVRFPPDFPVPALKTWRRAARQGGP
jgi:hypothetical protein